MDLIKLPSIPYGSLFFAPMEGITDEVFRKTILKLYPDWDYLATDFLRVPSAGIYPKKHLIHHFGAELFQMPNVLNKTMFQILTSHSAFTEEMVKQMEELKVPWLDMNLGCPSNTVCKNRGGSFLLTDLNSLKNLIKLIRRNFKGRFSCKVRLGFHDFNQFEENIKMLNDEGVESITVHARTRDDMYKTPARWEFIEKAVKISKVPIIGNGDVWSVTDIQNMLNQTGCHGVMIARGALRSPWLAKNFKSGIFKMSQADVFHEIRFFFKEYRLGLEKENISERGLLKQSKAVIKFMLEGIQDFEPIRKKLLLIQNSHEFYAVIDQL